MNIWEEICLHCMEFRIQIDGGTWDRRQKMHLIPRI